MQRRESKKLTPEQAAFRIGHFWLNKRLPSRQKAKDIINKHESI